MPTDDPAPTPEQLLDAYADDPSALAAPERAAVEALVARDPAAARQLAASRAIVADLRAAAPVSEPDWDRLTAAIAGAIAAEPAPARRAARPRGLAAGGLVIAAAAALLLWARAREAPRPTPIPAVVTAPTSPPPSVSDAPADADLPAGELPDDLGGLGGLAALDDDAVAALDEADDTLPAGDEADAAPAETLLPDSSWLEALSDSELDRALEWLETQTQAGPTGRHPQPISRSQA